MRRLWLIIALASLGGCATVYEDRYVYYPDSGYDGDYYYDRAPTGSVSVGLGYGYSAYDSVFWGLHHSYLDPFWYPGFYYGVTYFPSYYGWSSWYAGDYWRWRNFHPYSPYYGSYWDHYYAWNPHRGHRHDGFRQGHGDGERYGSARNAAERMARSSRGDSRALRRSAWVGDSAIAPRRGATYSRAIDGSRGIATRDNRTWSSERLPSRGYAPGARQPSSRVVGSRDEGVFLRDRASRDQQRRAFVDPAALPGNRQPSVRSDFRSLPPGRDNLRGSRSIPGFERGMSAPPRQPEFRQSAPARSIESRPSMGGDRGGPSMRSSGGSERSSSSRGSSRGRSER